MKKIDLSAIKATLGSGYPAPYDEPCRQRKRLRLGDVAGLTQFGVNLLRLPPGVWSSQRHWHTVEDEFVYIVEGEVVLISDAGEEVLRAGDCAGFKAGEPNGHHLLNRTDTDAVLLEIGSRNPESDGVDYPDIDLTIRAGARTFLHKDGTPYPPRPR
ncbi:MAG TPA: cupin domain-containing protein [Steroidobacteraceae bacterium]|nr:cupin domain-containing protein [Steroidobacteraceae bacterium]